MKKRHASILALFLAFTSIFAVFATIYYIINSPAVQNTALGLINKSHFKIKVSNLEFDVLRNRIILGAFSYENEKNKIKVSTNSIELWYSPINFLRGKLLINKLSVDGLDTFFPEMSGKKEKVGDISIEKLFILRNLIIEDGEITGTRLNFANRNILLSDSLNFEFRPRLIGDVGIAVNFQGIEFKKDDESYSAGNISIVGKTSLGDWTDSPPYVNSIRGRLNVADLILTNASINNLSANLYVKDKGFKFSDFQIKSDDKVLKGFFEFNLTTEKYKAELKIPEPIPFPRLGTYNSTIDTSGRIQGEVAAEGMGLDVARTTGSAKIDLTHIKEPLDPVNIRSEITWKNGVANIGNTLVRINDGQIAVKGNVNIPGKKIEITCDAKEVPLTAVFGRFGDENFHPISGTANATATINGWGKNFKVVGDAYTTDISGYYKIETDRAHAKVEASYHELTLIGEIEQGGKRTGDITLKIKYGGKVGNEPRPKNLHIDAKAYENDLSKSFREYGIRGMGSGHLVLDGPQRAFKGKLDIEARDGSVAGVGFQKLTADADMGFKKIKITDAEILIPNMEPVVLSSPVNMDFETGGFRAYGKPLSDLSFDINYKSSNQSWQIKNIDYAGAKVSGTYAPKGNIDITLAGSIDAGKLSVFREYLREAEGPIEGSLKISGPTSNPSVNGRLIFGDTYIYSRILQRRLEHMKGTVKFEGHTLRTDDLKGLVDDGEFAVKGYVSHENLAPSKFDVSFDCENLRYVNPERTLKVEFASNARWTGTKNNSTVSGDVNIIDTRYTKDFVILGGLKKSSIPEKQKESPLGKTVHLDLKIKNSGDVRIKNNIGDVWLKVDIDAKGTVEKPIITGTIETPEGMVHYLGKDFIITKGFVEFRDPYTNPYIEIIAEHEVPSIPDLVITVTLHGRVENLVLDLSATKAMDQRDIVSLLLFGVTEQEIRDSQTSSGFGQSLAASQISHMLKSPVTKLTKLDTFRLETGSTLGKQGSSSSSNLQISKIYLGKQLSDRMLFEFYTDINSQDAQQNVRANYLLTDYLMLNGESSTGQQYRFSLSLRFNER